MLRLGSGAAVTLAFATLLVDASLLAQRQDAGAPRESIVERSRVWMPIDVPSMDLRTGPAGPGSFAPNETVTCEYVDEDLSGASPKFACRLPDGDQLKVKYGGTNGEVYGEVAASRLLWALGFGADRMYSVRVVCRGCPERIGGILRDNGDRIVDPAAVERKLGRELVDKWDWEALERTDPSAGGATPAERDALKLLAVLLQHSDSKPRNQRIVCLDTSAEDEAACARPMMIVQDLGVTFGRANPMNQQPRASVNLAEWAEIPIWKGTEGCVGNLSGSLKGTLKNPTISEAGRKFLGSLLAQLSDEQLGDMFEAARVALRPRSPSSGRSGFPAVDEWVQAFKRKRAEIVERHCGS
mgnify:CR=1 FL=1